MEASTGMWSHLLKELFTSDIGLYSAVGLGIMFVAMLYILCYMYAKAKKAKG